jgi:hypothetical protein
MSRKKKSAFHKPRSKYFVMLFHEVIDSDAYKSLSLAAQSAYVLLLRQKGTDPDKMEVKFPFSDAKEYMRTHTFSKAIDELGKMGFIETLRTVRMGKDIREPNTYRFIEDWRNFKRDVPMVISNRCDESVTMKMPKRAVYNDGNVSMISPYQHQARTS